MTPPVSLWDRTAAEPAPDASLDGDAETDLAVVGGGFTGLSTALHAAQDGMDVLVLEAQGVGHGGSGRNVGLVNAGLWLPPDQVAARLGPVHGAALVRMLGEAPSAVFDLIERHQIRCEATRSGTIHAAHSPAGLAELSRRTDGWIAMGAPVTLLSAEQTRALTGGGAFHGGLLDRRAGTLNPMGYARGLARAAAAAGARIAVGAPVTGLTRSGDRWTLTTPRGRVRARMVVLAVNAYADALWPGLRRAFTPIDYLQIATAPLGARAEPILRDVPGLWDTGAVMVSLRKDAFGRLILGAMGRDMGALTRRFAARRLARMFPDLGPVRFEQSWHGRIAMTPDHLPRILRLDAGLYAPIGYNGRGIAPGTAFGRAMAALARDGREDATPVPVTPLRPVRGAAVRAAALRAAFAATQLWRAI
jgi:glycine/D-amino acid oxidase-like deaminating enzyme